VQLRKYNSTNRDIKCKLNVYDAQRFEESHRAEARFQLASGINNRCHHARRDLRLIRAIYHSRETVTHRTSERGQDLERSPRLRCNCEMSLRRRVAAVNEKTILNERKLRVGIATNKSRADKFQRR